MSRGYAGPDDLFVIESGVPLGALGNRIFNLSPFTNVVTLGRQWRSSPPTCSLVDDVHLLGDGGGGDRVITVTMYTLMRARLHFSTAWNTFARRINERKETDEGEVINGKFASAFAKT